jgi:cytidylate kinase
MTALAHTSTRHGNLAPFADARLVPYRTRNASIKTDAENCMTVIALTREIGSLGTEVAAGVAKKLGLKNIHSEIVAPSVAQRLGVAEDTVLRHVDGSPSLLDRWQVDRRKLSRYTSEEIMGLAQHGKVLIQGWGAAALLRDIPQVISVRVCAPMDFRVHVMMERLGNKNAKAVREEIEKFDAARARAMRALFNIEGENSRLHHIVLNTERLSVEDCVHAVCEVAENPRFQDHATTRSALADKWLEAKISSALTDKISMTVAPLGVSVSVAGGKITLAGTTTSGGLRAKAEQIVHAVAGIANIENRIVSVPSHGRAQ